MTIRPRIIVTDGKDSGGYRAYYEVSRCSDQVAIMIQMLRSKLMIVERLSLNLGGRMEVCGYTSMWAWTSNHCIFFQDARIDFLKKWVPN